MFISTAFVRPPRPCRYCCRLVSAADCAQHVPAHKLNDANAMPTHLGLLPCCNKRVLFDWYTQRNCFMCPMNDGVECGACIVLQTFSALEMQHVSDTLRVSLRSIGAHCTRHRVFDNIMNIADECTPARNRFAGKRCVRVCHAHARADWCSSVTCAPILSSPATNTTTS